MVYNTASAGDLATIANHLNQIATKYTNGSQQLDQQVTTLDNTASQLVSGGAQPWVGASSDAFQGAWGERKARMQQASTLMSQSAQYLQQLIQTIDDHLPTIRTDQAVIGSTAYDLMSSQDQQSVSNEESQAQNAIFTALSTLNSQLEALAQEVKDCPEEQDNNIPGGVNDPFAANNNSGEGENGGEGGDPEGKAQPEVRTPEGRLLTNHAAKDLQDKHNMTLVQVDDVIDNYTWKTEQADGATVYIKRQPGRGRQYSIVIEGEDGIVTGLRDQSAHQIDNLSHNYGFPWPLA